MRILRLLCFIVFVSALLDVLYAMTDRGQQFKTATGKCLSFNRFHGRRKTKRLRLQPCAPDNDNPDQWIYIRKINKHEGVFYNFAGNLLIAFNTHRRRFEIIDRVDLYRGGESSYMRKDSPAYFLRRKLESLWRKYEKCKKKEEQCRGKSEHCKKRVRQCSRRRRANIKNNIKKHLKDKNVDNIVTYNEAKWIVQRPLLRIRHPRRKNSKFDPLYFNLQDKPYPHGYYKIKVSVSETEVYEMKKMFMVLSSHGSK